MSTNISMHYNTGDPSPTIEVRILAETPTITFGPHPQSLDLHLWTPAQARDLAASMVAAARALDDWADTVDPDPIAAAAERLIATHEQATS